MSFQSVMTDDSYAVAIAIESALGVEGTVWVWIDCEMPAVSYDAAQTDTRRSRSARGAVTPIMPGRILPTLAIRFPEQGQLVGYDPTTDSPVLVGAMDLLRALWGASSTVAYQAAGVSPTDGKTVSLATSAGKIGCLMAALEADGSVEAMGFIQSQTGAGPWAATLFEDMRTEPGTSVARLPTLTFYFGDAAPASHTVRVVGEDESQDYRYRGCVPLSATRSYDAESIPYWEVQLPAYGGEHKDADGGLDPDRIPALQHLTENILGRSRHVFASNIIASLADGTADDGTCNIRNLSITIEAPHRLSRCPTAPLGVGAVKIGSQTISASFAIPELPENDGDVENIALEAWKNSTPLSLSLYEGDEPGRGVAINIAAGSVRSVATPTYIDGVLHRQVEMAGGLYAGDGASTDAGNKPHRFSIF